MPGPSSESIDFLKRMIETPSPSGFEAPIQNLILNQMKPYAQSHERDVHGNQWFVLNPAAPMRVMLMGHVDEIALMIRYIDEQGYIWVDRIGGTDPLNLWGTRVTIHTKKGPLPGVIGKKPIHHVPSSERDKGPKLEDVFIDIGVKDKKAAEKLVCVGDTITHSEGFQQLNEDLAIGRGMDDRIGVWVVMEAFRKVAKAVAKNPKKLGCALYAVGSVQEEVGLRGARTATHRIDPHVGIAVDVGFATDYPGENKKAVGDFKLGGGPIVAKGPNINLALLEVIELQAQKHKIPYQLEAEGSVTGTDAGMIQVSRHGVATALVSIPNRYMHSPVEMISLSDAEHAAELLAKVVLAIKPDQSFIPE